MSVPFAPTITYPNGGESLSSGQTTISWSAPSPPSADGKGVVYEIYFTDDFDPQREPDWRQLATLPSSASSFQWNYGKTTRSDKCRVAVRSRNTSGERSEFSISAANFSLSRKKLLTPTVINPVRGGRYDKHIEIVTDDRGIIGTYSQRSSYTIYYSSIKAGIPVTLISQNVPVGSRSVIWDISSLPPASDYVLQIFLKDDGGNVSDTIYVRDLDIAHEGFFLVDTTAPVGAIAINFNADTGRQDTFTRSRDVTVQVVAYDDGTAVHAMELTDGTTTSKPDAISNIKRFTLSSAEEVKTVQLLLQDYGANRNADEDRLQRLYHTVIELDDTEIADLAADPSSDTVWAITSGSSKRLCRVTDFAALLVAFEDTPTAISVYQSMPHVSTKSSSNTSSIYRYNGEDTELVKEFTSEDSTVNSMAVHGDNLYLGMENGIVYSFDGLNFDIIDVMPNPVRSLYSDGNLLYLVQKSNLNLFIYNGTNFFSTGA